MKSVFTIWIFSLLLLAILAEEQEDEQNFSTKDEIAPAEIIYRRILQAESELENDNREQKASSESAEYAAAVSAGMVREQAPVTLTDEQFHNLVHIKLPGSNKTKKPKTTLTLEKLKKKGYSIEKYDKETGVVTLKATNRTKTTPQPFQIQPQGIGSPVVVTAGNTSVSPSAKPVLVVASNNGTTSKPVVVIAEPSPSLPKTSSDTPPIMHDPVPLRVITSKNDSTVSSTTRPTPPANYKTTASIRPQTIEEVRARENLKKCPSFQQFINGSIELWSGLRNSDGMKEGFGLVLDAALDTFAAVSQCVTKIFSDIGGWFGKIPSEIANTFGGFGKPKTSSTPPPPPSEDVKSNRLPKPVDLWKKVPYPASTPTTLSEKEQPIHIHQDQLRIAQGRKGSTQVKTNSATVRKDLSPAEEAKSTENEQESKEVPTFELEIQPESEKSIVERFKSLFST